MQRGGIGLIRRDGDGNVDRRMGRYERFMNPNVKEDARFINQKIARLERQLRDGSPRPLDRRQRQALEKRIREDEEWLKSRLTPRRLYNVPQKHPDFRESLKNVKREFSPEFQARAERWKNNRRLQEPESPEASNLETLRPD